MKKLLVIAILMLALVFTVVACTGGETTEDTTIGDTTVETPTDTPTEESTDAPTEEPTDAPTEEPTEEPTDAPTEKPTEKPTEPPTEPPTEEPTADPADPVWIMDAEDLAAMENTVTSSVEKTEDGFASFTATGADPWFLLCGNIGEMPKYMAIRYRTNTDKNGEFFISNGANPEGGKSFVFSYNANSEWNLLIFDLSVVAPYMTEATVGHIRYDFFVDIPAEGTFLEVAYIAFFNTAEYATAYDFEQYPPYAQPGESGMKNVSFDTFYLNNQMYFPEDGGADAKLDAINNTLTFNAASELESIILRGWIGFDQPIDTFGYYVDNYEFVYGDYKKPTEDGVLAAGGEHATRFEIFVDLSYLEGDDHFVGFVVKLADGTIVQLREDITIDLPDLPKDVTDSFATDIGSMEIGTGMDASDLSNFFAIELPLGSEGVIANGEGKAYHLTGISDMYADVNGRYFAKINFLGGTGYAFVRGYKVVNSDEVIEKFDPGAGIYKINNYYETDSAGMYGGAGIYANLSNGNLNLVVKYYNAETVTRVGNKMFTIPVEGTELTMADNGSTVSIMVNGVTYATVALSGSKVYEDINEVQPINAFAEKAVVTLKDGTTETIENTLVAATCECQIGLVARATDVLFDSYAYGAYSAIEVPAIETETPDEPAGPTLTIFNGKFHANVDHINGAGPAGAPNYNGVGASVVNSNGSIPVRKAADDGIVVSENGTVVIGGWMAVAGGINHYAYTINGGELIVAAGGIDGEPLPNYYADLGMPDSTKNGRFPGADGIVADLSAYAGQTVTVTFYAIPEAAQETVAPIVTIEGLVVPGSEPETPVVPEEPAVENYLVPQSQWVITGHNTQLNDASNGMVAAAGVESAALLHQGSIALGEIDLSKYSKVVVMWGCDNSDVTINHYNANANNRIMLLNAEMSMVMSPAAETVIAGGTYELKGWAVTAFEIDLTGIDYNGPVWLAIDALPGTFALVASVEFIA